MTPGTNERRFRYFQSLERVQFRIVDTFSAVLVLLLVLVPLLGFSFKRLTPPEGNRGINQQGMY